ncbi:hypothetical protein UFOVP165_8 [uncultured Caudovirales phage]|uniref:Uncharacterized protein n=1 Tax=uncultured Caudovirales phage TaxID=2100421 RepID=A0A6J5TAY7_9CAUD|nr:hypothetical protein UFOVP72_37 [uncultured Caudovirales phage]CAB5187149.1 hypothetical protein UFOVP165_8 [uncultured Caudovirales phage]
MPLDTSIASNVAIPQFNVAPAQVGGPVNMLTDVMKLKGLQQEQQLNQLKFQEYQRARSDAAATRAETAKTKADLDRIFGAYAPPTPAAATNALVAPSAPAIPQMGFGGATGAYTPAAPAAAAAPAAPAAAPGAPNYAGIIGELVKGGHIEEAKKMADLAKIHTETRGKDYENNVKQIDAAYAPLQGLTNHVQSPADVAAYTQMLYNDPVLGPQAAKIKPLEQAIADSQREFAANPQQWQLAHSKVDGKVIYDAATSAVTPKIVAKDVGGSIKYIDENPKSPTFMKEVGDFAKTPVPKAPGELETPEQKLAFEGKKLEQKSQFELEKAYPVKKASVDATMDDIDAQIARAEALKNHEGLSGITGGLFGRVGSVSAASTSAQADLNQLKAKAGFEALQSMRDRSPTGGALGNVSDTEGRRLESSAAALEQAQGTEDFQIKLDRYVADLKRSKQSLKNALDAQFSGVKAKAAPAKSDGWTIEEH